MQADTAIWSLLQAVISDLEPLLCAGAVTYFPCGAWLRIAGAAGSPAAVHGSSAQPLELLATSQDPRQYLREYKVMWAPHCCHVAAWQSCRPPQLWSTVPVQDAIPAYSYYHQDRRIHVAFTLHCTTYAHIWALLRLLPWSICDKHSPLEDACCSHCCSC